MASPVITPPGPLTKDGKVLTNFTSNQDVVWTSVGGTLSNVLVRSVTLLSPNQTRSISLSGNNGADPLTMVNIVVKALIPNYWTFQNPVEAKKDILTFEPYSGPTQTRGFGSGTPRHDWELGNDDDEYTNFVEIKAFWDYHYSGKLVDMIDPVVNERRTYKIDSNFGFQYNEKAGYAWKMRIREEFPFAVTYL